jgi:hypothetical protein
MSQSNFQPEAVYFFPVGFYLSEMVETPEGTGYVYGIRHLRSHACSTTGDAVLYIHTLEHFSL